MRTRAGAVAAVAALVMLVVPVANLEPSAAGVGQAPPPQRPHRGARSGTDRVDPSLFEVSTPSSGPKRDGAGRIVVVVEGDARQVGDAVRGVGGEVTSGAPSMVEAVVPQARLEELGATDGVELVRAPSWFKPAATSEGVASTNAAAWHVAGEEGAGIEVAIVDGGFAGYSGKLGTELPATVATTSFCPGGGMGSDSHGTAVAEMVHDMAPGANLRLICIDTDADMYSVGQTLINQGIRIANMSGGFLLTGRGDGSGGDTTPAGVVRTTRLAGVLWAVAGGNEGASHYGFVSTDRDVDGDVEFDGGTTTPQYVDPSELQTFAVAGNGGRGTVSVRWDAWPSTADDYDIYVWDLSTNPPAQVGASDRPQYPYGLSPVEEVTVTNSSGGDRLYGLEIWRYQTPDGVFRAPATTRFDMFLSGDADLASGGGRTTASGSTVEPATSPYAMAVGAACYSTGQLEPFSSQGPTIDGRLKPDITGPDGVSSSVFGSSSSCATTGFFGTSAATPHVAGAAAVYLASNPALDVAELQRLLEVRAVDAGATGRDAAYGAGLLALRDPVQDPPAAPTGGAYSSLEAPARIVETRSSAPGGCVGPRCGALGSGQTFTFDARALAAVPDDATAVVLNVTAVATTQTGFLTVYPSGGDRPTASSVNFPAGTTLANHVTATLGSDGKFVVYNHFGTTHVVIDLLGYYSPASGQGLTAITPVRALETRSNVPSGCLPAGFHCSPFGSNETLSLPVRGATFQGTTIPTAATAVVLNVTAVQPSSNGYITVWPGGATRPTASSLNFSPGSVVPNLVIAGIGADGAVNIYNYFGTTDVVIDVLGYFEPGGARYVALDPPTRTLDTRTGTGLRLGPLTGSEDFAHQVGRLNGVPLDAVAALLNVTVAGPAGPGFLTVYPYGATRPSSSNVNFGPGAVVSNGVITAIGTGGRIRIYNHGSSQSTSALADLSGYFIAP